MRCLEQIFGYNIPKEDRKDIWTQNIYKILVETIQNLSREKGLSTLRNNLYNKRNSFVKKRIENLTDKSLERLTSSGLGTRTSQMMNPPTAMILPGTMKE